MIDDMKIKEAAEETAQTLLESLPAQDDIHHTFSPRFKKKMKKLLWKEKYPVIYYVIKSVACMMGAVILSGVLLLTCSEDARAAVFGWFKELRGESYFRYFYESEEPRDFYNVKYETSWLPEGYSLTNQDVVSGDGIYIYLDTQGNIAQFTYVISPEENNANVYVDGNNPSYEYIEAEVWEYEAELYCSLDKSHTSTLIWSDENNTLFVISAMLEKEDLIKWAESVVAIIEE